MSDFAAQNHHNTNLDIAIDKEDGELEIKVSSADGASISVWLRRVAFDRLRQHLNSIELEAIAE